MASALQTQCKVCKQEFYDPLNPEISEKRAQTLAKTHWGRHCREFFVTKLKCLGGQDSVWVRVNAIKRAEGDFESPRWPCPSKNCNKMYQSQHSLHEHWNRIHVNEDRNSVMGQVQAPDRSARGSKRGDGNEEESEDEEDDESSRNSSTSTPQPHSFASPSNPGPRSIKLINSFTKPPSSSSLMPDSTSSTSQASLQAQLQALRRQHLALESRLDRAEEEVEEEEELTDVLKSKTHDLETRAFSLRDLIDKQRASNVEFKHLTYSKQVESSKEISTLKERLWKQKASNKANMNGVNGGSTSYSGRERAKFELGQSNDETEIEGENGPNLEAYLLQRIEERKALGQGSATYTNASSSSSASNIRPAVPDKPASHPGLNALRNGESLESPPSTSTENENEPQLDASASKISSPTKSTSNFSDSSPLKRKHPETDSDTRPSPEKRFPPYKDPLQSAEPLPNPFANLNSASNPHPHSTTNGSLSHADTTPKVNT